MHSELTSVRLFIDWSPFNIQRSFLLLQRVGKAGPTKNWTEGTFVQSCYDVVRLSLTSDSIALYALLWLCCMTDEYTS